MGLLDFAKDIGKKLFGSEDEAPDKITEHIENNNPGIDGLSVTVENGTARVSGTAKSAEAREKTVLMVGNTLGIENVVDQITAPEPEAPSQYYIVKSGDTLWKIAQDTLGDGNRYPEIFEANREVVEDPDKIFPGQKLRIPG